MITLKGYKYAKRNYTAEQIIIKLRKIEVLCGQGQTIAEAVRQAEISEQTYYRWRKQYGGMNTNDAKRLQMLEKENSRLTDGSCIRLRPERKNHVWSYDFVEDRLIGGKKIRWLNIIDEYTRECLGSFPRYSWRNADVIETLSDIMIMRGTPEYLRSDNVSEFIAKKLRQWLSNIGVSTTYIEPGSPWENGYCESFNSRMRDEFLNGELFGSFYETEVLTKRWVKYYNEIRPHSSLGGKPPAPQSRILGL